MKVLLVNGSPHKEGCTHTALSVVADQLRAQGVEADEFWIGAKPIAGCVGCYKCSQKGSCVFGGDAVEDFLAMAGDYDGYVFGTPVYFSGMAGSMKAFMDRVFFSNRGRVAFELKPAAVVASARRAGTTAALEQIGKYVRYNQMIQVNSCYWTMVHGSAPEDVLRDEEGVQVMQVLASNMAWLLKAIDAAQAAGIAKPSAVNRVFTNFIR